MTPEFRARVLAKVSGTPVDLPAIAPICADLHDHEAALYRCALEDALLAKGLDVSYCKTAGGYTCALGATGEVGSAVYQPDLLSALTLAAARALGMEEDKRQHLERYVPHHRDLPR